MFKPKKIYIDFNQDLIKKLALFIRDTHLSMYKVIIIMKS